MVIQVKAIILAAGRGSRMKALTNDSPKCLVELHGKTLLDWQCDALRSAGIEHIAIVTGYKREMLTNQCFREFHNTRWAETNMVSSLVCASEWLQSSNCIISYSDIFYDSSAVRSLSDCSSFLALTYDPNWLQLWTDRFGDPLLDAESFRLTSKGFLTEIGNKPTSVGEVQGQYMGLLRFTPTGWTEVRAVLSTLSPIERDRIDITHLFQKLLESNVIPIRAIPYEGYWGEIDSEMDLLLYNDEQ